MSFDTVLGRDTMASICVRFNEGIPWTADTKGPRSRKIYASGLQSHLQIGGGFSLPVKPHEHLNFLLQVQKDLEANAGGVGVIALEYCKLPFAFRCFV